MCDCCLATVVLSWSTLSVSSMVLAKARRPWCRTCRPLGRSGTLQLSTALGHWNIETTVRICVRYGMEDFTSC